MLSMAYIVCKLCVSNQDEFVSLSNLYFDDTPAGVFIKQVLQIETDVKQDMLCKICQKVLTDFYVFYKMVKTAQHLYGNKIEFKHEIPPLQGDSGIILKDEMLVTEDAFCSDSEDIPLKFEIGNKLSTVEDKRTNHQNHKQPHKKSRHHRKGKQSQSKPSDDARHEHSQSSTPRFEVATEKLLSKYTLDQITCDRKTWTLSEESKDEAISLYVDLKCSKCTENNIEFVNISDFLLHYKSEHQDNPKLKCCRLSYADRLELEKHILYKHILKKDLKRFKYVSCPVCKKSIKSITLKYHLVKHLPNDKRAYQCEVCTTGFATKWRHASHMRLVHSDISHPCAECNKTFKNKPNLMNHIKKVHSNREDNILLCPGCGKRMKNRTTLTNHLNKHFGTEEKVKCHLCGVIIKRISLNRHMRLHDPTNQKQCPHCPYKANNILEHVRRVHEKIRPHNCPYCPMKFREMTTMKDHVSSRHTGIPKYKCDFCDKTFMCAANSITHAKRMHPKQMAEKKLEKIANCNNLDNVLDSKTIMNKKYCEHTDSETLIQDINSMLKEKKISKLIEIL